MRKIKNVIFFAETTDIRAGGPSGYIANLAAGLGENSSIAVITKDKKRERYARKLAKWLTFFLPTKKTRAKARRSLSELLLNRSIDAFTLRHYHRSQLDDLDFESITCHRVIDVGPIRRYLSKRKHPASLILMSHTPEAPSNEEYNLAIESGSTTEEANLRHAKYRALEKAAFESADILLFPSRESMEPYEATFDQFNRIQKSKRIIFMETGAKELRSDLTKEEIFTKYNFDDNKFNVCYIGRHNVVKGYDLLKNVALQVFEKRSDIRFVIGGKPNTLHPPLQHPNWLELGFINPAEVLTACDVFVLPNRQTYFDLILLEVLSVGIPVIASNTGGNKSVFRTTEGAITLYSTEQELVEQIISAAERDHVTQNQLRKRSRTAYEKNYALEHFAQRYINLLDELTNQEAKNV